MWAILTVIFITAYILIGAYALAKVVEQEQRKHER